MSGFGREIPFFLSNKNLSSRSFPHPSMTGKYMLSLWAVLIATMMLSGCKEKELPLSAEEIARLDSLALHVAVMPVTDCLPLVYAVKSGITDSMGLDVRLHHYTAQMDVDTALLGGRVEVAYSDLIRGLRMMPSLQVKALMCNTSPMTLVALKTNRVKKAHQLKERMVAVSRLSLTDFWCDALLDSAFMQGDDIYRPQVHDVQLRTDMLRTGLIDAAMMPSPYASWMIRLGHKAVSVSPAAGPHLAAWLARRDVWTDSLRYRQVEQLVEAYQLAVKRLAVPEHDNQWRQLVATACNVPQEMADSMRLLPPQQPVLPSEDDVKAAARFLERRERLPIQVKPDSLLLDSAHIPPSLSALLRNS